MKRLKEIPLYDWATEDFRKVRSKGSWRYERYECDRRGEVLIYVNRHIDGQVDPGISIMGKDGTERFKSLYRKGYLTGRALEDAKAAFPDVHPEKRVWKGERLQMYS